VILRYISVHIIIIIIYKNREPPKQRDSNEVAVLQSTHQQRYDDPELYQTSNIDEKGDSGSQKKSLDTTEVGAPVHREKPPDPPQEENSVDYEDESEQDGLRVRDFQYRPEKGEGVYQEQTRSPHSAVNGHNFEREPESTVAQIHSHAKADVAHPQIHATGGAEPEILQTKSSKQNLTEIHRPEEISEPSGIPNLEMSEQSADSDLPDVLAVPLADTSNPPPSPSRLTLSMLSPRQPKSPDEAGKSAKSLSKPLSLPTAFRSPSPRAVKPLITSAFHFPTSENTSQLKEKNKDDEEHDAEKVGSPTDETTVDSPDAGYFSPSIHLEKEMET